LHSFSVVIAQYLPLILLAFALHRQYACAAVAREKTSCTSKELGSYKGR